MISVPARAGEYEYRNVTPLFFQDVPCGDENHSHNTYSDTEYASSCIARLSTDPPASNRGGKAQNPDSSVLSTGWISGTFPLEKLDQFRDIAKKYYPGDNVWKKDEPGYPAPAPSYQKCWKIKDGPKISWSPGRVSFYQDADEEEPTIKTQGSRPEAHFEVTGKPLESLPLERQLLLLTDLLAAGLKPTRIDLSFDDRGGSFTPETFKDWSEAGYLVGFQRWTYIQGGNANGQERGSTFYAGSRGGNGSGKFLRIYDKLAEQNRELSDSQYQELIETETSWTRIELELSAEKAIAVVEYLVSEFGKSLNDAVEAIKSIVLEKFFTFMIGRKRRAKSERQVVPQWLEFIKNCVPIALIIPKKPKPEGFNKDAFKKSWGGHLTNILMESPMGLINLLEEVILNGWNRGYALPENREQFDGLSRTQIIQMLKAGLHQYLNPLFST